MGLQDDFDKWAAQQPRWQQYVLDRLSNGIGFDKEAYRDIAHRLVKRTGSVTEYEWSSRSEENPVKLAKIHDVQGVNALLGGQELDFSEDGVTVVYGHNGSGKSGYARLIKQLARARHAQEILSNVFDEGVKRQSATVHYQVNGVGRTGTWPADPVEPLAQIRFYDGEYGAKCVRSDLELSYRPSLFFQLDDLVAACDGVRAELTEMRKQNEQTAMRIPQVPQGTDIGKFLAGLAGSTAEEELDAACELPDDAEEQVRDLKREEARLTANGAEREAERLHRLAAASTHIAEHLDRMNKLLGKDVPDFLRSRRDEALALRGAAENHSENTFVAEPLPGVGSSTWRALWQSARAYSELEAYRQQGFPVVDGDGDRKCVLCHQPLDGETVDRMLRFRDHMAEEPEREAEVSESAWTELVQELREVQTIDDEIASILTVLDSVEADLATRSRAGLKQLHRRQQQLLAWAQDSSRGDLGPLPDAGLQSELRAAAEGFSQRAVLLEPARFAAEIGALSKKREELEGRLIVREHYEQVLKEIERLRELDLVHRVFPDTSTGPVTNFATKMSKKYATPQVRNAFAREAALLDVSSVTLKDRGSTKGRLKQRPVLESAVRDVDVHRVFSEGEQTALGLAVFFTEVAFDTTRSSVVMDDPMTSLDHVRRRAVAKRIAQLARDRQVIVFTHDVSFAEELGRESEKQGVANCARSVRRRGGSPGLCADDLPWKAKDFHNRLSALESKILEIKRHQHCWDEEAYEEQAANWAGGLSETWERLIREIANGVFDRSTLQVQPKMFRLFARIADQDNDELQQSYARCSQWAKRHDKPVELNYVPPTPEELHEELAFVRGWYERVRKYWK